MRLNETIYELSELVSKGADPAYQKALQYFVFVFSPRSLSVHLVETLPERVRLM